MQCYKTFAATTLIANTFEILPEVGRKLPLAAVADWMAQHDIEPEDVLYVTPEAVREMLVNLIESSRPQMPHAA